MTVQSKGGAISKNAWLAKNVRRGGKKKTKKGGLKLMGVT